MGPSSTRSVTALAAAKRKSPRNPDIPDRPTFEFNLSAGSHARIGRIKGPVCSRGGRLQDHGNEQPDENAGTRCHRPLITKSSNAITESALVHKPTFPASLNVSSFASK